MKTYLVTGAAGFIGSNFVKYMLGRYDDVRLVCLDLLTYAGYLGTIDENIDGERCIFVRGDIGDRKLVDSLMKDYDVDVVVNFAAESHVDRSIENPQLFLQTNILGTQTLLEAAKAAWQTGKGADGFPTYRDGVRYHQVSTDEVYGSLGKEGYFTENTPLDPHSPYSASKASADHFVAAYRDTYHLPVSITRCSNNYGPYHFPEKLIPLILGNILKAKPLPVYGKGENIRDWLYVEDHCKAIDMVVRNGKPGNIYNVGGHNERQNIVIVRTILTLVREEMEQNPELRTLLPADKREDLSWIGEGLITYVTDRLGHDLRYGIDPQKIKDDLGWYPETDFETGIRKTVHWYLTHREWVEAVSGDDYQQYYERMYAGR
ncbi:MAG: dTDP-glucose 4,6-dehydratase [Bacteroidaceae bacterium]|nr:dTDP-glucose 4,6-dehydratase [Bacteroidaceae bacterium]